MCMPCTCHAQSFSIHSTACVTNAPCDNAACRALQSAQLPTPLLLRAARRLFPLLHSSTWMTQQVSHFHLNQQLSLLQLLHLQYLQQHQHLQQLQIQPSQQVQGQVLRLQLS